MSTDRKKSMRNPLWGKYNASPATIPEDEYGQLQIDSKGNLKTALNQFTIPQGADYLIGQNSGANFVVTYKSGGASGTVLKTVTVFNHNQTTIEAAVS
jgi:hypothetical protein